MIKKLLLLSTIGVLILAVLFWFNRDQWLADFNKERQQQSALFTQKGLEFSKNASQAQCMEQSFKQLSGCFGFECTLDQGVFVRTCLNNASASENFCDAVPKTVDNLTQDDKDWLKDSCWDKDVSGEGCRFLYKQKIQYCTANSQP